MNKKYIIPFVVIDPDYHYNIPDQSDQSRQGCEIECIINLDEILNNNQDPIIQKRICDKSFLKGKAHEGDIGCLHIEHNLQTRSIFELEGSDNPSINMQVFYSKEVYDMFLPIILNAYRGTEFYSLLIQRHRNDQIGKLFN